MAQALLRRLKRTEPDCEIHMLAPAWTLPVASRMAEVDEVLDLPFRHGELHLRRRWRLGRDLRQAGYSRAYVLPNSFKSALLPFFARIPARIGWVGEARWLLLTDCRRLDPAALPLMVDRFASLAGPYAGPKPAGQNHSPLEGLSVGSGLPAKQGRSPQLNRWGGPPTDASCLTPTSGESASRQASRWGGSHSINPEDLPHLNVDEKALATTLTALNLNQPAKLLALCPGAEYGPAKQWPPAHFASVATAFAEQGWAVYLFGSAKDRAATAAVTAAMSPSLRAQCHDLAGRTDLSQAIDLLSLSSAVVSNDSGLMHIAAALGRPLVALYGSTSPDFTPPLTEQVAVLHTDIECRPCFQRQCPYGHLRCLTELQPQRAIAALQKLTSD